MKCGCTCSEPYFCSRVAATPELLESLQSHVEKTLGADTISPATSPNQDKIHRSSNNIYTASPFSTPPRRPQSASMSRHRSNASSRPRLRPLSAHSGSSRLSNKQNDTIETPITHSPKDSSYFHSHTAVESMTQRFQTNLSGIFHKSSVHTLLINHLQAYLVKALPFQSLECLRAYHKQFQFVSAHICAQYNHAISRMLGVVRKESKAIAQLITNISSEALDQCRHQYMEALRAHYAEIDECIQRDKDDILERLRHQDARRNHRTLSLQGASVTPSSLLSDEITPVPADLNLTSLLDSVIHQHVAESKHHIARQTQDKCFEWLQCIGDMASIAQGSKAQQAACEQDFHTLTDNYIQSVVSLFTDLQQRKSTQLESVSRLQSDCNARLRSLRRLLKVVYDTFVARAEALFMTKNLNISKATFLDSKVILLDELKRSYVQASHEFEEGSSRVNMAMRNVAYRASVHSKALNNNRILVIDRVKQDVESTGGVGKAIWAQHIKLSCSERRKEYLTSLSKEM